MRSWLVVVVIALVACIGANAYALDRNASMIDSAGLNVRAYDHFDVTYGLINSETALLNESKWSIIGAVGAGTISAEGADKMYWLADVGVKRYLKWDSSLALLGTFEWAESGKDMGVYGMKLAFVQRLMPVDETISPYIGIDLALQSAKITYWTTGSDRFTGVALKAAVGCDFMLNEDCALAVEGAISESTDVSESLYGNYADGYSFQVALKYYWQ